MYYTWMYILHVQSLDTVPNAPGPTRRWQCNTFLHVFKLSLGTLFTEPVEIMKRYWILMAAPRCFFVITHVEWNAVLLVNSCQATPASNFKYQNLRISYRFLSISHVSMKSTTSNRSAKINKSFISAPIHKWSFYYVYRNFPQKNYNFLPNKSCIRCACVFILWYL